jgi:hypothetical protein
VNVSAIFAWLHQQAVDLMSNIAAVASNRPEPARQAVASTLVTAILIWLAFQIGRKVSK